ncbi:MAG: metallophosphoesterase family protein, partial [Clostridia bacterium]|nr:metallophosphoesterase family protein [Clostridia bacterium]
MAKKITAIILSVLMIVTAVLPAVFAQETENTPYRISVSINGDTGTQKGLCWYTGAKTGSVVEIYLDGEKFDADVSNVTEAQWEGAYMHKVTVKGLLPGRRYTYGVGDGNVFSDLGSFVTDDGDDSFSFIEIADVQAGSLENFKKAAATLNAAFDTCPDAEFVANCGDFTNDSTNEEWDFYDEAFSELNLNTTIAPVTGNHDGFAVWNW